MMIRSHLARLLAVLSLVSSLVLLDQAPAAAAAGPTVSVNGHGWGHGRGMSQYGAYGYAKDHGWTSAQILDHYYGGTTAGPVPANAPIDPNAVRVELREERDMPLVVGLASGSIDLVALDGNPIANVSAGYVRTQYVSGGFLVQQGESCRGPWTNIGANNTELVYPGTTVRLVTNGAPAGVTGLLHLCEIGGVTWYGGEMRAVYSGGRQRAVNVVSLETYLRGVVPREIPASWATAALQVQAVAARSYVMAGDSRQLPYADTCNTTLCQVYDGLYQSATAAGPSAVSRVTTDAAISATSNVVRIRAGAIARTEFSSSSGGYTAGGDFPAVVDEGDDVSANPNHDWSVTADLSALEASYNHGRLLNIEVTERNGLGAEGGRVKTVKLTFDNATVYRTGNSIRRALSLKSDWFSFSNFQRPVDEQHRNFVVLSYETFWSRPPSNEELNYWLNRLEVENRARLTEDLVFSDAWTGSEVDDLYQRALGRESEPGGRAYWIDILRGKTRLDYVGVQFYGSQEYYNRSGGTDEAFVAQLYLDILGRPYDDEGFEYWVGILRDGRAGRDGVSSFFYYSIESRRSRATTLVQQILGRGLTGDDLEFWATRLTRIDELDMAVELGTSAEFNNRAQG